MTVSDHADSTENSAYFQPLANNDLPSEEPKRQRLRQARILRTGWNWDTLATTVSLLRHGAIIVILAKIQNRALENWTFFSSINTVVSKLTTVSKSTMLFSVGACLGQLKWIILQGKKKGFTKLLRSLRGDQGAVGRIADAVRRSCCGHTFIGLRPFCATTCWLFFARYSCR